MRRDGDTSPLKTPYPDDGNADCSPATTIPETHVPDDTPSGYTTEVANTLENVVASEKLKEGGCDLVPKKRNGASVVRLVWALVDEFATTPARRHLTIAFAALAVNSVTNLMFPRIAGRALDVALAEKGKATTEKVEQSVSGILPRGTGAALRWLGSKIPGVDLATPTFSIISAASAKSSILATASEMKIHCAIAVSACFATGALASWHRVYHFRRGTYELSKSIRSRLYASCLEKDMDFYEKHKTGDLASRLLVDADAAAEIPAQHLAGIIRGVNAGIGGVTAMLLISGKLTLIALGLVPLAGYAGMTFSRRAKQLARVYQDETADAIADCTEKLSNIKTVRSFGQEKREAEQFNEALGRTGEANKKACVTEGCFMGGVNISTNTSLLAVLLFGGGLIRRGELTPGGLTSFAAYSALVGLAVAQFAKSWSGLVKSSAAIERIREVLDAEAVTARNPLLQKKDLDLDGRIQMSDVTFAYASRPTAPILRDFSLTIEPREIVGLVGVSGCGKSTLASLLLKLYRPQSGKINIDSHPIESIDAIWWRQNAIAVLSQEPVLFQATIADNIRYAEPSASMEQVQEAAIQAQAHEFIDQLPEKYNTILLGGDATLSVGQKQRIAIARVIITNPKIVIFDEATSNLDKHNEEEILATLQRVSKGRTTVIIAHTQKPLSFCDRIVDLGTGELRERKAHETVTG